MGACVIQKPQQTKSNQLPSAHVREDVNDLQTRQFSQPCDKKTARAFHKQSYQNMRQFLQKQPKIIDNLITQTTKQPDSQLISTQNEVKQLQSKSRQSFCSSVQRQFEVFDCLTELERDELQNLNQQKEAEKFENLNNTSDTKVTQINPHQQLPKFLRKYLPMQQYSIEIKYL